MRTTIFLLLALLCGNLLQAQGLTGRDIMQKVKDRDNGDTRSAQMTMTLTNKNGRARERKLSSFSMDIGKDTKTIMFFTYPGDVKGTGFLTWDYDDPKRNDDKWLYLPAMKKTRRISGKSAKTDYFMGSDFTYDDMGSRNVDEDSHSLLREENLNAFPCWVVESVPKEKNGAYSRKVSWVRQEANLVIKVEYYDKLNKLQRQFEALEIEKVQGFWMAKRMLMRNVQTGHSTLLLFEDPKFNIKLAANLFTVARLEQGL